MTAVTPAVPRGADERAAAGRAARRAASRAVHAEWTPAPGRENPVAIVERQEETRIAELVPIRHARMLRSPFAFFRGAAAIMATDLAGRPSPGLTVQLCGDAHLGNFGTFAGPDRRLVFDLNDFDETLAGPFEWDVARLATSVEVAGRDRAFAAALRRRATRATVRSYRERCGGSPSCARSRSGMPATTSTSCSRTSGAGRPRRRRASSSAGWPRRGRRTACARSPSSRSGWATRAGSSTIPPLLVPLSELLPAGRAGGHGEAAARPCCAATGRPSPPRSGYCWTASASRTWRSKVVGVGSVGTRAWVVLMLGRDESDPLVLQIKEAQRSVLEPHLGAGPYRQHGRRVVEGQRLMQAASDMFLGWLSGDGRDGVRRDFYVRQLWDGKGSADLERIPADRFTTYGELCGAALARAHARSGDPVAIAAYLGRGDSFDRAMHAFAVRYADQNDEDFAALEAAADAGRIAVAEAR